MSRKFLKTYKTKNEKGAAAVEFALILPILVIMVFGIFQFGIAFNNWISLTHAAREGARLAAVGQYTAQKVRDSAPSVQIQTINVTYSGPKIGDSVTVQVIGYVLDLQIPLVGNWPVQLTSTAVMRREQ